MRRRTLYALLMSLVLITALFAGVFPASAADFTLNSNNTGRPYASVEIQPGGSANLTANVSPADISVTYKWGRSWTDANGNNQYQDLPDTGSQITVSGIDRPYYYMCTATDSDGVSRSCSFNVSVNNGLRFDERSMNGTVNSTRVTAALGDTVKIIARAGAADTTGMTYKWYKYPGQDYNNRTEVSGLTGPEADITVSGSETYEVQVTDAYGNTIQANFTIIVENHFSAVDKNTGDRFPTVDTVPGGNVTLEILVSGDDLTGVTAGWSNGAAGSTSAGPDGTVILSQTITGVNEQRGLGCTVSDRFGNTADLYYDIRVNHLTATAGSTGETTQTIDVNPGDNQELKVTVTADDMSTVSYSWSKGHFDENGYNFTEDEYLMGEEGDTLKVSSIYKTVAYKCSVNDSYGNWVSVYFKLNIDNNFSASIVGTDQDYKTVRVPYGGDAVLEVKASGNDLNGVTYVWEKDGVTYSTGSASITIPDVFQSQSFTCTVTDKYGNFKVLRFTVLVDLSDDIYAGFSNESPASGLDDAYYAKAWVEYGENLVYVTPLKTVEEASASSGLDLTNSKVYIWVTFNNSDGSFDEDLFRSDCQRAGVLAGTVTSSNGNTRFKLGVPLWSKINAEETSTTYFSVMSRKDKFVFASGPASYGGLTIGFQGAGTATVRDGWLDVNRSYEFSKYFKAEFDDETATLTVTPLVSYTDFLRDSGCKDGTLVGFDMGLTLDGILFPDTGAALGSWQDIYDNNANMNGTGSGGFWTGMGSGFAVRAWTENEETFSATGEDPDGNPFTVYVKLVTLDGPPPVETVVSEPVIDTASTSTDDAQAVEEIVQAIKDSDSLGIGETLNDAAYDSANSYVEGLMSNMTQEEIDNIDKFEVQSYLEVAVTELVTDEAGPALTLEISPKYDIVQYNKDGTEAKLDSSSFEVHEEVEIVLYVGNVFGDATSVTVTHIKDNGNTYMYVGSIDSDGYLRFTNPNGFSSFKIEAAEDPVIVNRFVSGNEVDTDSAKSDSPELLEEIAGALEDSNALGFSKALNAAASDAVDVDAILESMSEADREAVEKIEVQTYVEISILELSADEKAPKLVVEISPKYRVVKYNRDGSTSVIKTGDIEISESVDIELYVGDLFGKATKAVIKHTKGGKSFEYSGTIDEEGYVRFTDPDGFSTFEITPSEVEEPSDPNDPTSPKTDDLSGTGLYGIMTAISLIGIAAFMILRRRLG